jgi:hypothetical protein
MKKAGKEKPGPGMMPGPGLDPPAEYTPHGISGDVYRNSAPYVPMMTRSPGLDFLM